MFGIDVSPHTLTSEWIVMTNARVFHNNEIHNNERTPKSNLPLLILTLYLYIITV